MSVASANWEKLKSTLPKPDTSEPSGTQKKKAAWRAYISEKRETKRMRGVRSFLPDSGEGSDSTAAGPSKPRVEVPSPAARETVVLLEAPSDDPLVRELREMVAGRAVLNESKRAPGNYIAIDCEMVGVNRNGSESAVARVSLVNYHGHVLLDTFVRPKERITDFRTWISGVREGDLKGAPGLEEVQAKVTSLCDGRVLIGHAIENDLRALLLSHPKPMIRDTQRCKALREIAKSKSPGLSRLAAMELGVEMQKGAHSSVTDARATMALYRLHKGPWEQELRHATETYKAKVGLDRGKGKEKEREESRVTSTTTTTASKRKRDGSQEEEEPKSSKKKREREEFPGGGRKGISSGLSTVLVRNGRKVAPPRRRGMPVERVDNGGVKWWEALSRDS